MKLSIYKKDYDIRLVASLAKNVNIFFFYQKFVHLGDKTSTCCSQIIVGHVHETVSILKFSRRGKILQTVSNQEVTTRIN